MSGATVRVVQRGADDVQKADVIGLPEQVFVPITASRGNGERTWIWQPRLCCQLANPHRWRYVLAADEFSGAAADTAASAPNGFVPLVVSDFHPERAECALIVALRCWDLVDVQLRTGS